MNPTISDLSLLLSSMKPELNEGVYVFASVPVGTDLSGILVISTFREAEGITVIAEELEARRANLPVLFRAAWIMLTVNSDLQAVGLAAAFASALGEAGISCNVIAAAHHDHIFVPVESADVALERLQALQKGEKIKQLSSMATTNPSIERTATGKPASPLMLNVEQVRQ